MQGRKPEEEIQQLAFTHGYAKISHSMWNQEEEQLQDWKQDWVKDNFAWYAKSSYAPTSLDFYLQIFCVILYFLFVINLDIFFNIFLYFFW